MKRCKKCGQPMNKCFCHIDFDLEELLKVFNKQEKRGKVKKGVTEEKIRKRPPKTKNDLEFIMDAIGLDERARDRIWAKTKMRAVKTVKDGLHGLIDDLIPDADDLILDAEYEIECPVCGKMVKDLENHDCEGED